MKRFLLFIIPLLIIVLVFFGIYYFFDKNSSKGALQVTSVPKSTVYLDNKMIGTTPLCICDLHQRLSVGDYTIRLVPTEGDFKEFQEKITINRSTLTVVDRTFSNDENSDGSIISLIPLNDKEDIEIMVVSVPSKANVFLDNSPIGITPLLLKNISESDHDLRISRDGYKDKTLKIKTAFGYRLHSAVFLSLDPDLSIPPIASPSPTIEAPKVLILDTPNGFLRVRESNSISALEISRVKPGETYELVGEAEGWFQIKLSDEISGWVSSSYASKN